ncbi:MAG: hypothetical protein GY754_15380 [bacterium]|nr:hypothetical protein [bacterium]
MSKNKSTLLTVFFLLGALFYSPALKAAGVSMNWEPFPEAVKYNVSVINKDKKSVVNRMTRGSSLNCRLGAGNYKVKVGIVLSKNFNRIACETRWLAFTVKSDLYQNVPTNPGYIPGSEKGDESTTVNLTWNTPNGPGEKTILYRVFRKTEDNKYVDIKKSGFIRIGQQAGSTNKVKKYLVYKYQKKDYRVIGETTKTVFAVQGVDPDSDHTFAVRSVNLRGKKSGKVDIPYYVKQNPLSIALKPCFILPVGFFSEHLQPGWGGFLAISKNDALFRNLELGCKAGYWYLAGKRFDTENCHMVPIMATVNYNFNLTSTITISPLFSTGINIIAIDRFETDDKMVIRPMTTIGGMIEKNFRSMFFAELGTEFGMLFDQSRPKMFCLFNVRVGVKL